MLKKKLSPKQALMRLENICSRSEHCTGEIKEKLYAWGVAGCDIGAIIEHLTEHRFIDDARFTRSFVNDRLKFARWGRRKIAHALTMKRVDRHIIDNALAEIDETEYRAIVYAVMTSRLRSLSLATDRNAHRKAILYGVQRGFEPELVIETIRSIVKDHDE